MEELALADIEIPGEELDDDQLVAVSGAGGCRSSGGTITCGSSCHRDTEYIC